MNIPCLVGELSAYLSFGDFWVYMRTNCFAYGKLCLCNTKNEVWCAADLQRFYVLDVALIQRRK